MDNHVLLKTLDCLRVSKEYHAVAQMIVTTEIFTVLLLSDIEIKIKQKGETKQRCA